MILSAKIHKNAEKGKLFRDNFGGMGKKL